MAKTKEVKKKTKQAVKLTSDKGRVYVNATFNNTLVTITDANGNTLFWSTAGAAGFKGARKSTPFAATTAVETIARKAQEIGMKSVDVYIKGPGVGRDAALRGLKSAGLAIAMIADVTPIPHNGPRAEKKRRV